MTSRAQDAYGTGGFGAHRVNQRRQPQPAGGLAAAAQGAFDAKYGGLPAHQAVAFREAGSLPSQPGPSGGLTKQPLPKPGMGPSASSEAEAASPGFHTGNAEPGIPAREAGHLPGAQFALSAAGQHSGGQRAATEVPGQPAPDAPPLGYTSPSGKYHTWDQSNWEKALRHGVESDYIKYASNPYAGYFQNVAGAKRPNYIDPGSGIEASGLRNLGINVPFGLEGDSGAFNLAESPFYLENDFLRALAHDAWDAASALKNQTNFDANRGDNWLNKQTQRYDLARQLLGRAGVNIDFMNLGGGVGGDAPGAPGDPPIIPLPGDDAPGGGGGAGGGPGGGGGGAGGSQTDSNADGIPDVFQDPGDLGNIPGATGTRNDLNVSDTDLNVDLFSKADSIAGDVKRSLGGIGVDLKQIDLPAMMEFEMQRRLAHDAQLNKQKGVNIMQGALDQSLAANNPFRAESEKAMLAALKDPDPTDWEGIKNRLASDFAKSGDRATEELSQSAARRGVPLGAMAGAQMNLSRDQGNDLARALGELENQQALQGRNSLYQALAVAGDVDRNYRGGESVLRQTLANAVMGAPSTPQNPFAGLSNTAANLKAIQTGIDAQEEAEKAAKKGLYGDIGGALLGAAGTALGGPLGAALFGK